MHNLRESIKFNSGKAPANVTSFSMTFLCNMYSGKNERPSVRLVNTQTPEGSLHIFYVHPLVQRVPKHDDDDAEKPPVSVSILPNQFEFLLFRPPPAAA